MIKRSPFVTGLAVNVYFLFSGGCTEAKTGPEPPDEAVRAAISLLEAKHYSQFIKRFWSPADLENRMKELNVDHIDDVAKKVYGDRPNRVAKLIRGFHVVKDTRPVLNEDRTQATFRAKDVDGNSVIVTFKLIDGNWCLTR